MTDEMEELLRAGLRNPYRVVIKQTKTGLSQRTPTSLRNYYTSVDASAKFSFLLSFIADHPTEKLLVFFSTCAQVDYFSRLLKHLVSTCHVTALHGKLKEERRQRAFNEFRSQSCAGVLMATDVMARGIDIPDIDWVIQYDVPSSARGFVHRCGRTARLDQPGNALLILLPNELPYIKFLKINQNVPLLSFEAEPKMTTVRMRDDLSSEVVRLSSVAKTKDKKKRLKKHRRKGNTEELGVDEKDSSADLQTLDFVGSASDTSSADLPSSDQLLLSRIRKFLLTDRNLVDKGLKAFVSFIQSYAKHECSVLLRTKDLDIGGIASDFGLIKLPRMPELKNLKKEQLDGFVALDSVNIEDIPYLDKNVAKQKLNQRQIKEERSRKYREQQIKFAPWSKQKSKQEKQSSDKRSRQRDAKLKRKAAAATAEADLEELAKDTLLLKKFKKGKITSDEFDTEFDASNKTD